MKNNNELKGLKIGNYFVNIIPEYISQFASRELVSDILNNRALIEKDPKWKNFGFTTVEEYSFWSFRLCGIICTKMAMLGLEVDNLLSIAELTKKALEFGGYILYDENGKFIDKGWFYAPLVELVKEYGLKGEVIDPFTEKHLCKNVLSNIFSIVSVNPKVIRFDVDKCDQKGGHLVLVVGFKWNGTSCEGFYIHNSSGRTVETQEKAFIPIDVFNEAFASRGFVIKNSR